MGEASGGDGVTPPAAQVLVSDCIEAMRGLNSDSVDAIVTDPPYGLEFMGREWDHGVPGVPFWVEALRVLKPGGHLLAFGGTRTYHRLACAIEDAGFEVRDCLMWLYGSGFPKSLDVSKAIDRVRDDSEEVYRVTTWVREARDAAGIGNAEIDAAFGFHGMAGHWTSGASQPTVPTLEQVPKLLDVLGDPEVPEEIRRLLLDLNGRKGEPGEAWFRREMIGTHPGDMGGLGGQRLGKSGGDITAPATEAAQTWEGWGTALKPAWESIILARVPLAGTVAFNVQAHGTGALNVDGCRIGAEGGRWPANLLLDGEAAAMLDEQSGGGASRFFYTAKASGSDRGNRTFEALPLFGVEESERRNAHPTVKPTPLMDYLCRLVTPPGGLILDPFCGSGSTGVAAIEEGFRFLGIEREEEYAATARERLAEALEARL